MSGGERGTQEGQIAPTMDLQLGYLGAGVMLRYGAVCVTPAHRGQGVGLLQDHWTEEIEGETTQPNVHLAAGSLDASTHPSRQNGQVPPLVLK